MLYLFQIRLIIIQPDYHLSSHERGISDDIPFVIFRSILKTKHHPIPLLEIHPRIFRNIHKLHITIKPPNTLCLYHKIIVLINCEDVLFSITLSS